MKIIGIFCIVSGLALLVLMTPFKIKITVPFWFYKRFNNFEFFGIKGTKVVEETDNDEMNNKDENE